MTCIDIFKNINIITRHNSLAISPCCISPVRQTEFIDFENNEYLSRLRKEMISGQFPAECSNCKNAEDVGLTSRRQSSNAWYKDNNLNNTAIELVRMDYWTGDMCNLACVICGPHNSSKWKQELNIPIEHRRLNVNHQWENIDLSTLKFIHFNGGEPLLSKEHVTLLSSIIDKSKVHITYNTNGTILPTEQLLHLWSQFKLVHLDISIDDMGDRFEYQRYPAKWEQLTHNLQWFIDNCPSNCMFGTNTSIGVLNHDNIDNLMNWLETNFYVTKYKDPIKHNTQLTIGTFELKSASSRRDSIVKFLNNCDSRRGTNWKYTFPNLDNYLKTTK